MDHYFVEGRVNLARFHNRLPRLVAFLVRLLSHHWDRYGVQEAKMDPAFEEVRPRGSRCVPCMHRCGGCQHSAAMLLHLLVQCKSSAKVLRGGGGHF